MALGILAIIYVVIAVLAIGMQIFLYKDKEGKYTNTLFIVNMLFGVFLSFIAYTSLPSNYTEQKIIAIIFGIVAVVAFLVKLNIRKPAAIIISKLLLTISIVGGIIQLVI